MAWTNQDKSGGDVNDQLLEIGDGFNLLIDSTYKLQIQEAGVGITWTNKNKN